MSQEYGPRVASLPCYVPGYGRILLYDDMEGVLKWGAVDGLGGSDWKKAWYAAHDGEVGLRIGAYRSFPNGWAWAYGGRSVGLRGHKHVRVTVVFRSSQGIIAKGIRVRLRYYDGTYRWQGSHQYDFVGWDRSWHCLMLEMDFSLGVYVDGWLDGVDLGISGNALSKVPNGSPEVMYIILAVGSTSRRGMFAHFDPVLVQEV